MRVTLTLSLFLFLSAAPIRGQSEQADPYSVAFVQRALNLHAQGIGVSFVEKRIPRLGDQLSIALLKIFGEPKLTDNQAIRSYLPLIHQAFSEPQFISEDVDRKPQVTLLLLAHLHRHVSDAQTQRDIEETIKFVKEKTAK